MLKSNGMNFNEQGYFLEIQDGNKKGTKGALTKEKELNIIFCLFERTDFFQDHKYNSGNTKFVKGSASHFQCNILWANEKKCYEYTCGSQSTFCFSHIFQSSITRISERALFHQSICLHRLFNSLTFINTSMT